VCCGTPLSTYTSNLVKISWLAAEICPTNRIWKNAPSGRFLLTVPTLTPSVLWGPLYVSCKILAKSDSQPRSYGDSNNSRWPPSAILDYEESLFGPFRSLRDPISYVHTKFGEDIFIIGGDMPPKRNSRKRPWRRNSTSAFKVDAFTHLGPLCVSSRKISAKSHDWQTDWQTPRTSIRRLHLMHSMQPKSY